MDSTEGCAADGNGRFETAAPSMGPFDINYDRTDLGSVHVQNRIEMIQLAIFGSHAAMIR